MVAPDMPQPCNKQVICPAASGPLAPKFQDDALV